jgi:hypothetical protein
VLGAGGEIGAGGGQVVNDDLKPNAAMNSVTVTGFEDGDGTTGKWFVRAIAICAAASQRVVATGGTISAPAERYSHVFADCPSDWEATGGGATVNGGRGQVRIHNITPTIGRADAAEDENGFSGEWFLRAFAVCATPLPGLDDESNLSPENSTSPKSVTVTCPAGTRVVGAGGAGPLEGEVVSDPAEFQVVLDDITPNAALTSVTATAYEDETGFGRDWDVFAYANCAIPPPGLERVVATTPSNSSNKSVTATCPSGKNLLGTGGDITGGLGQVVLGAVEPNAALTSVTVTGLEDETGRAANWSLRSYAICANP